MIWSLRASSACAICDQVTCDSGLATLLSLARQMNNLDFAPPETLTVPLWRSLVLNVIDRVAPERLPPLQLSSKPMNVGMLLGDQLDRPWFRTVFTNIADVVSPEVLPPLELNQARLISASCWATTSHIHGGIRSSGTCATASHPRYFHPLRSPRGP